MRKILLLISFFCLPFLVIGQSQKNNTSAVVAVQKMVKIYPNPAFNSIGLNNISGIGSIIIYNLVGRKMKKFITQKGERYDIADLPRGMYLVQLLGDDGKVVTTQRMSKK